MKENSGIVTSDDPRIRDDGDLLFEVDPVGDVFDSIRERISDAIDAEYGDLVVADDFRSVLLVNHVELTPKSWSVDATIEGVDTELHVDLIIPADNGAPQAVSDYVDEEVESRFDVDPSIVRYKKIRLAAGGWFVSSVIKGG